MDSSHDGPTILPKNISAATPICAKNITESVRKGLKPPALPGDTYLADTAITEMPTAEDLADIAIEAAGVARRLGHEPRVAMLAFSNFGHPPGERAQRVQEAVRILDSKRVEFEYDGEMGADVALNKELMAAYPFCRLKDTANVLIMPAFHSAAISTRMLQELGGARVIGPRGHAPLRRLAKQSLRLGPPQIAHKRAGSTFMPRCGCARDLRAASRGEEGAGSPSSPEAFLRQFERDVVFEDVRNVLHGFASDEFSLLPSPRC